MIEQDHAAGCRLGEVGDILRAVIADAAPDDPNHAVLDRAVEKVGKVRAVVAKM